MNMLFWIPGYCRKGLVNYSLLIFLPGSFLGIGSLFFLKLNILCVTEPDFLEMKFLPQNIFAQKVGFYLLGNLVINFFLNLVYN